MGIVVREELAAMLDVAAETIHEIKPVCGHVRTPRQAIRIISPMQRRGDKPKNH
jgi:hypothetical protein